MHSLLGVKHVFIPKLDLWKDVYCGLSSHTLNTSLSVTEILPKGRVQYCLSVLSFIIISLLSEFNNFIMYLLFLALIVCFVIAKKKRAISGRYSPSRNENLGFNVEMSSALKPPPEERLIWGTEAINKAPPTHSEVYLLSSPYQWLMDLAIYACKNPSNQVTGYSTQSDCSFDLANQWGAHCNI